MAYNFVKASNQYISAGSAPVTTAPLTMSFICKLTSTSVQSFMGKIGSTANDSGWYFQTASSQTSWAFVGTNASSYPSAEVTGLDTSWNRISGTAASSTSRYCFKNTTKSTQNTTSIVPSSIDRVLVGSASTATFMHNGDLADFAIWNVELTDAEIASLSKGFKASRIRPQSLVFYAPLIRNINEVRGGIALTNNNTATVANHPRVY